MTANLMWIVTLISIVGTILNIKRKQVSFVIWLITNSLWFVYDLSIQAYAQSALFAVYVGLAIWGIIAWRKRK
jgi:nicotinamide riboside transporter PnuC